MGVGDQNIKAIQESVDTRIVVRGNSILLEWKKNELQLIEAVINEMMLVINQKGYIEPSAIHHYLSIIPALKRPLGVPYPLARVGVYLGSTQTLCVARVGV